MSGQSGIKGYEYQTLVAILEFLDKTENGTIIVEPKTEGDKVDIIINRSEHVAIQVKHTINSFKLKDAINWLDKLISDYKDADEYRLYLIGVCSQNEKFKELNKLKDVDNYTKLTKEVYDVITEPIKRNMKKILVESYPENINYFVDVLVSKLDNFLSNENCNAEYEMKKMIVKSLVGSFGILSTAGKEISIFEYKESILNHIRKKYPIEHEVKLSINLGSKDKIVNRFDLQIYGKDSEETKNRIKTYINILKQSKLEDASEDTKYVIDDKKFEYIKNYLCKNLEIDVDKELFCLSDELSAWEENIEQIYTWIYQGEKVSFIEKLLDETYPVELYLSNDGMKCCEDIDIELVFPNDIEIFNFNKLDLDDIPSEILRLIYFKIIKKLNLKGTSTIEQNDDVYNENFMECTDCFNSILNINSKYKIYRNEDDRQVLKYKFEKINVKTAIWFPIRLLFVTEKSFTIEYKISSKMHSKLDEGKINIDIN